MTLLHVRVRVSAILRKTEVRIRVTGDRDRKSLLG